VAIGQQFKETNPNGVQNLQVLYFSKESLESTVCFMSEEYNRLFYQTGLYTNKETNNWIRSLDGGTRFVIKPYKRGNIYDDCEHRWILDFRMPMEIYAE
jgi:hypothetical protein